jgi:hypothetical protein
MPATQARQFRLDERHRAMLDELAAGLSPVPLTHTQVVRLAIERLHESFLLYAPADKPAKPKKTK